MKKNPFNKKGFYKMYFPLFYINKYYIMSNKFCGTSWQKKKIFTSKITLWCGIVFISCIKSKCASSTVPYIRIFFVSSVLWCQFLKIPFSEAWNKRCVLKKQKKNCRFLQFYVKPTYSTSLNALPSHFLYILQLLCFYLLPGPFRRR